MSSGSAIRGSRVGSSPMRPDERTEPAPRREVTYFCAAGHDSVVRFAADAGDGRAALPYNLQLARLWLQGKGSLVVDRPTVARHVEEEC